MNWPASTNFESGPGRILVALGKALQQKTPLILFGSAALECTVCPQLTSANLDICLDIALNRPRPGKKPFLEEDLRKTIRKAGLDKTSPYIQVCFFDTFMAPRKWTGRAQTAETGNCLLSIPHAQKLPLIVRPRNSEPQ